jgi:hypothetical protein
VDTATIQTILGGAILAAILWLMRSVNEIGRTLTQIQTVLAGADGSNGINGEVKRLRVRQEGLGETLSTLTGRFDLIAQRVEQIEGREV